MPDDDALRGEVLDGRYELLELLGTGGMGEVWRARDTRLGREVAVKILAPPRGTEEEDRAEMRGRFDREARAVAALESPHVVALHDHGMARVGRAEDTPYLVMALVRGRTLEQALRDDGRIPWRRALDWTEQICRGLATAHAAGVVHRDIKPANAMVTDDGSEHGRVLLLDFGIARFVEATAGDPRLTRTGMLPFGSVSYMAPERFGDDAGGPRTDLYAVGCVLYELLVGRPPYVGTSAQVMYNHLNDVPLRPSRAVRGLPPAVDRLVLSLMARDPGERPGDALEAAEAMGAAASGASASGMGASGAGDQRASASHTEAADPDASVPGAPDTEAPDTEAPHPKTHHPKSPRPNPAAVQKPPPRPAPRIPAAKPPAPRAAFARPWSPGQPAPGVLFPPPPPPARDPVRRLRLVVGAAVASVVLFSGVAVFSDASDSAPPDPPYPPPTTASSVPAYHGTLAIGAAEDPDASTSDLILNNVLKIADSAYHRVTPGAPLLNVVPLTKPDSGDSRPVSSWLRAEPGLAATIGKTPYLSRDDIDSSGPAAVQICREDDEYLSGGDVDGADPRPYAEVPELRTSATEGEMARALARHLAAQPGVRKVYVRGNAEDTPTRALVVALRAAKVAVRVEHVGAADEPVSLLTQGIREFHPDAVFLQGDADRLTEWFEAVDASGFHGLKSLWSPATPGCAGARPQDELPYGFEVPPGWLAPRGYYSAALDPDTKHADKVRSTLGPDLAKEPYAVEAYDAALAALAAAEQVPASQRSGQTPRAARMSLVRALPSARPKGLLNTTWRTLAEASKHHRVWLDRSQRNGTWRQVT